MHQSSLDKMANFYAERLRDLPALPGGTPRTVLDLGSQDINGSYREIFEPAKWRYVGVDMAAGKNVDVVLADPYKWREFRTASVEAVVSGQAFEHTEFFWLSMQEIARVLKPGGLCCIIAPSCGPEHRYPVDCWRFYPDGMRALARYTGLECLKAETIWGGESRYTTDASNEFCDTLLIARKPLIATKGPSLWSRLGFRAAAPAPAHVR